MAWEPDAHKPRATQWMGARMKAEFSHYSYGIALAQELLRRGLPKASILPLLPGWPAAKEASKDTRVPSAGWPVFLRLTPVEYMLTPRARGWSTHEERFFRLRVDRAGRPRAHRLLKSLAEHEPEVYYVAPAFHRQSEFEQQVAAQQVVEQSQFIPLWQLPDLMARGRHFVTFRRGESGVGWHAGGAQRLDIAMSGSEWKVHLRERLEQDRLLGWRFLVDLRQLLVACREEVTVQPRLFDELEVDLTDLTPLAVLGAVRHLLLTQFGLEVLVFRRA